MEVKDNDDMWRPKPGVINTEMIRQAISDMCRDEVPGNNVSEDEGYEFHEITHLHLEHLDILRIDGLWIMPALTVLKLTGNLIKKIENLDSLVHLRDLNLSFNHIKKIENLDKLLALRHLSLYSNEISKIENMEPLKNLKIFTIGANRIKDKQCILHLRQLDLFSLNMADNPCALEENFRHFIAGYMPTLEYYEYKKITEEERNKGRSQYVDELEVLERAENESRKELKKTEEKAVVEAMYHEAFVEKLDENQIYDVMMETDPSGQALILLGDDVEVIFEKFSEGIGKYTKEIFNLGLEQLEIRKKEIEMYDQGVQDAIVKSQEQQREILENFIEQKTLLFTGLNDMTEAQHISEESLRRNMEEQMAKANNLCSGVKKELLDLELVLTEQLKEVFALFERSLGDMVNAFIETAQGFFTNMRELETVFSEQLGDLSGRFLTQMTIRNEDVTTLPPPLRPIMMDKEAVNTALASCHDIHLQVIDNREDQLINRIRTWYHHLCHDYEQKEITRFRDRISEIVNYIELQAKDFQMFNLPLEEDILYFSESN